MLQGEGRGARVAVGTVNRVLKLLDAGALTLERTRFVVIDMEMTVKRLLIFNMYAGRGCGLSRMMVWRRRCGIYTENGPTMFNCV